MKEGRVYYIAIVSIKLCNHPTQKAWHTTKSIYFSLMSLWSAAVALFQSAVRRLAG